MDDLIKLRQKKIRQKLRYLQLELMETKIIYKNSLQKFHKDFSQDIKPDKDNKEKVDIKDPYEEIQTDVSEDTMKKVYRKTKKHPDKKGGDKKKFQIAAKAKKNNDFGQLLEMADELEIDIELSNELIDEMNKQCNASCEQHQHNQNNNSVDLGTLSTTRTRGITTIHISHHYTTKRFNRGKNEKLKLIS